MLCVSMIRVIIMAMRVRVEIATMRVGMGTVMVRQQKVRRRPEEGEEEEEAGEEEEEAGLAVDASMLEGLSGKEAVGLLNLAIWGRSSLPGAVWVARLAGVALSNG